MMALFVLADGLSGSLSPRLASSFTTDPANVRREKSAAEFAGQAWTVRYEKHKSTYNIHLYKDVHCQCGEKK